MKALDLRLDRQEALIQELLCREEFEVVAQCRESELGPFRVCEAWAAPAAQLLLRAPSLSVLLGVAFAPIGPFGLELVARWVGSVKGAFQGSLVPGMRGGGIHLPGVTFPASSES